MNSQGCSINCVVRHDNDRNCEFRLVQCPFVSCPEKVALRSLFDHLWLSHQMLQFPSSSHVGTIQFGNKTFKQNFAARPWCFSYDDKQFVMEVCRKNDTGLWHLWVFFVGSPREAEKFSCQIKIHGYNKREEISYQGPVISIDTRFSDIFQKFESLVVPDAVLKRLCDLKTSMLTYEVELKTEQKSVNERTSANPVDNENFSLESLSVQADTCEYNESYRNSTTKTGKPVTSIRGFQTRYGKTIYPDSHKLFVGNLFEDSKEDLMEIFNRYGNIVDIFFFKNSITYQRSPFYAFVVFQDKESVLSCCNDKPITDKNGRVLTVETKVSPLSWKNERGCASNASNHFVV